MKGRLCHFCLKFLWRKKLFLSLCYHGYQNVQNTWRGCTRSVLSCHIQTFDSANILNTSDLNYIYYSSAFYCRVYEHVKKHLKSYSKAGNRESQSPWSGILKDVLRAPAVCTHNIHHTCASLITESQNIIRDPQGPPSPVLK